MASFRILLKSNFCLSHRVGNFLGLALKATSTPSQNIVQSHSIGDASSLNRLVAQVRSNAQKSKQLKNRSATDIPHLNTKQEGTIAKDERIKSVSSGKPDSICDQRIRELINKAEFDSAIPELDKFYDLGCYPSRKTLEILASCFSKENNSDGILHIQQLCANVYPKEYLWMMGYEHYLAEVKWKTGQYKESIDLFLKLFKKYPLRRRKICNMTNFLMRRVLGKSLEGEYEHLTNFVHECAALNNFDVASNLWRTSFLSQTILGQEIGQDLMKRYPRLHEYVPSKFPGVIEVAYERNDIDILQRLVQTALESQLKSSYSLLLGALLNFQCEVEDVKGAMETFQYSSREKVVLPANTVQLFMSLLGQQKKKVPGELLNSKYKQPKSNKFEFKW